jgi:hypothetical protein
MDTEDMEQTRKWREFIEGANTTQGLGCLNLLEAMAQNDEDNRRKSI